MSKYSELNFKIPEESKDYGEASDFVIKTVEGILEEAIVNGENKNCYQY